MRFDKIVSFWEEEDPNAFNFDAPNERKLQDCYANVTDMGTNKQVEILGEIADGTKIIRMMVKPPAKWDYLMLDNDTKRYKLKSRMDVLKGFSMIVGVDHG